MVKKSPTWLFLAAFTKRNTFFQRGAAKVQRIREPKAREKDGMGDKITRDMKNLPSPVINLKWGQTAGGTQDGPTQESAPTTLSLCILRTKTVNGVQTNQ